MSTTWLRYALAAAGMLLPLLAQQGRGTISGTVTDTQGGAIPGVSVEIKNVGTNATFRANTNEAGFYTAPGIAVGIASPM